MSKTYALSDSSARVLFGLTVLLFLLLTVPTKAADGGRDLETIKKALPDSTAIANKVVYVDFWASWCMPCRKSFPWMALMQAKYADSGLVFVTISVDRDAEAGKKYIEQERLSSISLFDPKGKLAEAFELKVMPTSFVFDKNGELQVVHEGFDPREKDEFEQKLVKLLHGEKLTDE